MKPRKSKLLRLLQEGSYYPLGSDTAKRCQARIVTAANKSLTALTSGEDGFRQDLYYRLSTHLLKLPPLRERREDIPLLAEQLIREAAISMGREIPQLAPEALKLLQAHHYPGNIRELKSYLYDGVARVFDGTITAEMLSERLGGQNNKKVCLQSDDCNLEELFGHFPTLDELGEYAVDMALKKADNNQSQAARLLGLSKQALHKRLRKRQAEEEEEEDE